MAGCNCTDMNRIFPFATNNNTTILFIYHFGGWFEGGPAHRDTQMRIDGRPLSEV